MALTLSLAEGESVVLLDTRAVLDTISVDHRYNATFIGIESWLAHIDNLSSLDGFEKNDSETVDVCS